MAEIHAFKVGYCTHPACMAVKGAGLRPRPFPSRAYLLMTKSGPYLWDTGYAEHFNEEARGIYAPYRWVTPVHYQHDADCLETQLSRFGVRPRDIREILISHFHADHVAGLRDYPKVPMIASRAALDAIRTLRGLAALRRAFIPALLPQDFEDRIQAFEKAPAQDLPAELFPFTQGWPIDAKGELWAVALPGHAEGHMGAFVQTDSGWQLLAADAAWAPEAYREMRGPAELSFLIQHSRKEYYETLAKLHALDGNGIRIHLSHEM